VSPGLPEGGESAGRERLKRWLTTPSTESSRLSPYLHFGCLSPLEVERAARSLGRSLCWRDFFHQLLAARPSLPRRDYRPRGDDWNHDPEGFEAWRAGRTGFPFVDAGMRQLEREGWMHNRLRLVTSSFLVKDLYVDWRLGAEHFFDLLVDGDLANNAGNWQWIAGTGTDTRPNRVFNPVAQGRRFDPEGDFVRRYVPELADVAGATVHEPWRLERRARAELDYPPPIVDHGAAVDRFRVLRTT
jgi:deoxyribodipyrimidine photo-lyase